MYPNGWDAQGWGLVTDSHYKQRWVVNTQELGQRKKRGEENVSKEDS
jgi:hypothetical protein